MEKENYNKTIKYYLINDQKLDRIKYKPKEYELKTCSECGTKVNNLHKLGCSLEQSPCYIHEYIVDCNCPISLKEGGEI